MWSIVSDLVCNKRGQTSRPVVGFEIQPSCNIEANVSICDESLCVAISTISYTKIFLTLHRHGGRWRVTLFVLLDLSAAFDTVLLNRLSTSFGIRGSELQWFASYLFNRSQRVSFDQNLSDKFNLHCGAQGSCLGPLLFTIYASKLFEVIKKYLPQSHAYADDTQLYLSFNADLACSQTNQLKQWRSAYRLYDRG